MLGFSSIQQTSGWDVHAGMFNF